MPGHMSASDTATARRIRFRGTVESRHDVDDFLDQRGDAVLVYRGRARSLVLSCPDGCGTVLTVNLDPRSGKAWRLYQDPDGISLYPSVWRDTGCRAHFILWRDRLLWCGGGHGANEPGYDAALEKDVLAILTDEPQAADQIADQLDLIPWEASRVANRLVRLGLASTSLTEPRLYALVRPEHEPGPQPESHPTNRSFLGRLLKFFGVHHGSGQ